MGNLQPELWSGKVMIAFICLLWICFWLVYRIIKGGEAIDTLTPEERQRFGIIEEFEQHYHNN